MEMHIASFACRFAFVRDCRMGATWVVRDILAVRGERLPDFDGFLQTWKGALRLLHLLVSEPEAQSALEVSFLGFLLL